VGLYDTAVHFRVRLFASKIEPELHKDGFEIIGLLGSAARKLPIKATYDTRNFIAHDYSGVRIDIIKDITVLHLSELKENILKILDNEQTQLPFPDK